MFDAKTGEFLPLNEAQLARLNDGQRETYHALASEVSKLELANKEAADAIAENRATVAALHAAEASEAKQPKHTFLEELRRTQAQWRADHR
jgi:hypothetical protein